MYIKNTMIILSFFIFFDCIHGVNSGNVRGLGLQLPASLYTLLCYYILGTPLALWLGFSKGLGLNGFWGGFLGAMILLDIGVGVILYRARWEPINKPDTAVDGV